MGEPMPYACCYHCDTEEGEHSPPRDSHVVKCPEGCNGPYDGDMKLDDDA